MTIEALQPRAFMFVRIDHIPRFFPAYVEPRHGQRSSAQTRLAIARASASVSSSADLRGEFVSFKEVFSDVPPTLVQAVCAQAPRWQYKTSLGRRDPL
jgi:hypothetical protein